MIQHDLIQNVLIQNVLIQNALIQNVLIQNVRDLLHDMERSYEFMNTNIQKKDTSPGHFESGHF